MARFFGHDPQLGLTEAFHVGPDGDFAIQTFGDVQPILDFNKEMANSGDGYTPSRDMRRIASIPLVILEKWKNEMGVDIFNKDHARKIRQLLNDPDWRYLRTSPGRF